MTVAAIACGTNSTRLLVADAGAGGSGLQTHERLMRITRMGEGVDATGRLAPQAIDRVATVLREYREVIDRHGAGGVRITATSAARDAENRDELFDVAEEILGVRPELLAGHEEGRLSFLGATSGLDAALGPFLVVDIGGGSTEFAVGGLDGYEGAVSTDMGCVRITERFLGSDPPAPQELTAALSVIDVHIDDVMRELPQSLGCATFVGLAGTVSTVAAVEIGLAEYDRDRIHGFRLTKAAAEDVFRTFATEARDDRRHNPGLEPGRVDVIVGGCCVLVAVFRRFGFAECLVSESDILDGLAMSLLAPSP
jgi:exopolyphosphatase/guanosine-5'-triphosphate,3'-diphosphate pyrophosphatase